MSEKPLVFISSISSDIGLHCARRYLSDGWDVFGTYRSEKLLPDLGFIPRQNLYFLDLADRGSLDSAVQAFLATGRKWTSFMTCAAIPQPLTDFFACRFENWSDSIHVNAIEQLRVLHALGPARASGHGPDAVGCHLRWRGSCRAALVADFCHGVAPPD